MAANAGNSVIFFIMFTFTLFYMLVGYFMMKHHSKFPDLYAGYHVGHTAMKNHDTWEAANKYAGKVLLIISIIMLVLDFAVSIVYYIFISYKLNFIKWDLFFMIYIFSIAFIPITLMMIITEIKLKKTFDKYGFRKGELDVFSGK